MPFDVHVLHFVDGEPVPMDIAAVEALLQRQGLRLSGEQDYVELGDGLSVEISAPGLHAGDSSRSS